MSCKGLDGSVKCSEALNGAQPIMVRVLTADDLIDALTVDQLAEQTHLAPITIMRKVRSGEIRGIKAGRSWLIPRRAVDEWLNRGRRK